MAAIQGGTLRPAAIRRFVSPLVVPPAMPGSGQSATHDFYSIAVRQFVQQVLPPPWPGTPVWGFGAARGLPEDAATFHAPSFTIEATAGRPVRIEWINELVDGGGRFLPHLLPVDQTLHWANPPGGTMHRDHRGSSPEPYRGPVPFVVHVHGAHTHDFSDGHTEAWYVPDAIDIPPGYAVEGSRYGEMRDRATAALGATWRRGSATFEYPNDQPPTALWYHDHVLGMTRLNVYAGPAGFYLIRGGSQVESLLPSGPHEIPLAIQDRSFNLDGTLFYPDTRAFFEGLRESQLAIPFIPESGPAGPSDVSPIWNPEFFGNAMMVNGRTWPYCEVERRRYRLRLLNGCNSRFLILQFERPDLVFWQIGGDGGFLPAPVRRESLLLAPAERADVIVDFSGVSEGTRIVLRNLGPDEPFGGGVPGIDFEPAHSMTTGQIMEFRVTAAITHDASLPAGEISLPAREPLPPADAHRDLSLNELDSATVSVVSRGLGARLVEADCDETDAELFGPVAALLGGVKPDGTGEPLPWHHATTERPATGTTETWSFHNFTMDAHPMHVHLVGFEVVGRRPVGTPEGENRPPEASEGGLKDTVIAYPGEITTVKARFDLTGRYVWHCHIVEHEDNEMMRPFEVIDPTS